MRRLTDRISQIASVNMGNSYLGGHHNHETSLVHATLLQRLRVFQYFSIVDQLLLPCWKLFTSLRSHFSFQVHNLLVVRGQDIHSAQRSLRHFQKPCDRSSLMFTRDLEFPYRICRLRFDLEDLLLQRFECDEHICNQASYHAALAK